MDSIRNRLRPAVVAALLIAAAGGSAAVFAATPSEPIRARLHTLEAPCTKAVGLVDLAATKVPRVESGASATDADRAKTYIDAARRANGSCPGKLTGREQQLLEQGALVDKTYWLHLGQIHFANAAVLSSLDVQRSLILRDAGRPHGATSFAGLDTALGRCKNTSDLEARLRDLCARQLSYNKRTESGNPATDPNNPCSVATGLANAAGLALRADPEAAFEKAHAGLEQNKRCQNAPGDARNINQAYLMSWRAAADLALNIPLGLDDDIARDPNDRSPFAVANRTLRACATRSGDDRVLDATVAQNCSKQLDANLGFEKKYQDVENQPPCAGRSDCQPLPPTPFDSAAFQVRPEPQFWARPANNEHDPFAIELVRGDSGWQGVDSQSVRSGTQPWILFAAVRTWPEFTAIFDPATTPATVKAAYFKTKMLVVVVQRSPRQRCKFDSTNAYSVPGGTGRVVPAIRVEYRYRCEPPTLSGQPALASIVEVTPVNNQASVTFVENGVPLTTVRY
jgi:hypothetical protein